MEHRSRPLHLVPRLAADDIAAFLPFSYCTLRGRVRSPGHFVRPRSCAHIGPAALGMLYIDTPEGCQHGTHKRARLHTRHLLLLESTHTTHKHTFIMSVSLFSKACACASCLEPARAHHRGRTQPARERAPTTSHATLYFQATRTMHNALYIYGHTQDRNAEERPSRERASARGVIENGRDLPTGSDCK